MICVNGKSCTWATPSNDGPLGNKSAGHVQALRQHLLNEHATIFKDILGSDIARSQYLDYYEEACKEKDRQG
eukprot:11678466-Karenia_brevis.AAC.1